MRQFGCGGPANKVCPEFDALWSDWSPGIWPPEIVHQLALAGPYWIREADGRASESVF
jgi:hypothetical protein